MPLAQHGTMHQAALQGSHRTVAQDCSAGWEFAPQRVFSQAPDPPIPVGCWCVGAGSCLASICGDVSGEGWLLRLRWHRRPCSLPAPLLSAAQLGVFPWAPAELVPEISNGPIMPDVFTALGRK